MRQLDAWRRHGPLMATACTVLVLAVCRGSLDAGERGTPSLRDRVQVVKKGSSTHEARAAAVALLPLEQMAPANRKRAEEIVQSAKLFREMPTLCFEVDPRAYTFFAGHPDVAVSIWRVMGISKFQMWQSGFDEYRADAGDGTSGTIEVLYRSGEHRVVACRGEYNSPFPGRSIEAEALIHLQTGFSRDGSDRICVTHRAVMYVAFPSATVETVARVISPLSNLIIDRNFQEISLFLHLMSVGMVRRPDWVGQVTTRLGGIPEIRRRELLAVTAHVHAARRHESATAAGKGRAIARD